MVSFKEIKNKKGVDFTVCLVTKTNTNLLNVNTIVDKFSINLRVDTPPKKRSK